ncbi:MAG TPA: hypothetical protein VKI44_31720 [Acetobacteraceae bacterium]|nr:hypothetical protein [Acetobacteraceae bacterium]
MSGDRFLLTANDRGIVTLMLNLPPVVNAYDEDFLAHESWLQRQSAEGQEGTTAFREKRRPGWYLATVG